MLSELRITSLGVIDDAVVEPAAAFTVVTGETGAGKTMVVTALGLACGGRADSDRVRSGSRRAVVEARFAPGSPEATRYLAAAAEALGGDVDDDGSLVAVRSVSADGRSRAHIGGRSAPVSALAGLTEPLVAVHGQSEAMTLLGAAGQRAVLDRFAGTEAELAAYRRVRDQWLALRADIDDRVGRARERAQREHLLRMGIEEIDRVAPQPHEDVELAGEVRRLDDADALRTVAQQAMTALIGGDDGDPARDEPGAAGLVQAAVRLLESASDEHLSGRLADLRSTTAVLSDVAADLSAYLVDLDADPGRLAALLERQALLRGLVRRYGEDVDAVLAWADQAREELVGLDSSEEAIAALRRRRDELAAQLAAAAAAVTARRTAAADRLGAGATAELAHLAMGAARLRVAVTPRLASGGAGSAASGGAGSPASGGAGRADRGGDSRDRDTRERDTHGGDIRDGDTHGGDTIEIDGARVIAGPDGVDQVEILLTPRPGAPELPVARGASGGELSRVMLALEVVLAGADPVDTLVFDEVDAGVGGRAATEIGRRLALLARTHQVIVVTHLAQVAAFADRQYVVQAGRDGTVGASGIHRVEGEDRRAELARMLGGTDGDVARAHAADLLAAAAEMPVAEAPRRGRRRR